jgi:hypothetical protein
MKTHELQLIRIVDDLNERNKEIARQRSKPQLEAYSYSIWDEVGVGEVII